MHCKRKWQPTPVFLPGGSQGRGSLVGCRLWGRTELDTTEATKQQAAANPYAKRIGCALSKRKKKIHFNQFSPESREYHSYPMSKNLPILSIVIVL